MSQLMGVVFVSIPNFDCEATLKVLLLSALVFFDFLVHLSIFGDVLQIFHVAINIDVHINVVVVQFPVLNSPLIAFEITLSFVPIAG